MFNSRFITELLKSPTVKLYSKDLQRLYVPAEVFVLLSRLHEGKVFWPAYHIDMLHSLLTCSPVVVLLLQDHYQSTKNHSNYFLLKNMMQQTAAPLQHISKLWPWIFLSSSPCESLVGL
ncbi:uncharacterized protein LOC133701878 isoform X2 [Populus nigra]|nr:uncharacterized protein LOC133701878 isoform X2 [Populus nigra]